MVFSHSGTAQLSSESKITRSSATFSEDLDAFRRIFDRAGLYIVVTLVNFATTLAVFPAVTVLGEASSGDPESQWNRVFFIPVCCFIGYNFGMAALRINR